MSFPNFGHWRVRLQLLLFGQMPRTDIPPHSWYDMPTIHHGTIKDSVQLCTELGAKTEKAAMFNPWG